MPVQMIMGWFKLSLVNWMKLMRTVSHLATCKCCYHLLICHPDGITFSLSAHYEEQTLDSNLYGTLLKHLSMLFPQLCLCSLIEQNPAPDTTPLLNKAIFFDYAVVHQHRYYASNCARNSTGSLVEVIVSELGDTWVGELTDLIHINQGPDHTFTLGHFCWFHPLGMDLSDTIWSAL